jgi:FtsP/CotA-like multicopper oxidase with cupredoxin domain
VLTFMPLSLFTNSQLDRRSFMGAATMLCLTGGAIPHTKKLVAAADAHARSATAMHMGHGQAMKDPVDALKFGTPQPQPGGAVREYWIAATSVMWDIAPTGRDDWMGMPVPRARKFRAYAYQPFTPGFARALAAPSIPGPILEAEVGDVIVVHLRNADKHFGQGITMHPHGVRYTPDYDGSDLGHYTRAGGFIAPGEEFKYTWECLPTSVGVWPYHDHGPNGTINAARGLFGAIIIRPKGEPAPDVEHVSFLHSFPPPVTGLRSEFECINGRAFAGNTPTIRAKVGQTVAMHAIGLDSFFHTFHVHGHRWQKDGDGPSVDCVTVGPGETVSARWTEDNPGRWLYHCHVFPHQDSGMAGWYLVDPS